MGFLSPDLPQVDIAEWRRGDRAERLRPMARHIAERGMGYPDVFYVLYAIKIALFVLAAIGFALATRGVDGWANIGTWWREPIVFQKAVVWSLLYEVLGLGCGFGPLTGKVMPPLGSPLYWMRTGTIRLPPWPRRVPFTAGNRRSIVDVLLYAALIVAALWILFSDGTGPIPALDTTVGVLAVWKPLLVVAILVLIGLRDKTIFLAARGEVYGTLTLTFVFVGPTMIVAAKLVMLAIWLGAAVSKLNRHFPYVVATMMANNPLLRSKWLRRKMFRRFPDDLQPSWIPGLLAHGGTVIEFGVPLVLFFSRGGVVSYAAAGLMVLFHLVILTSIPLGVPLEWNVYMIFAIATLFVDKARFGLQDLQFPQAWGVIALMAVVGTTIVIGNLYPRRVSFLPGMRYYAGNWDVSVWCLTESACRKIEAQRIGLGMLPHKQIEKFYGADDAEVPKELALAFRVMFANGRALLTLLNRVVPPGIEYAILEGEQFCAYAVGWNFGDGHLHNEQLIAALQARCHFDPGEVRVIVVDGQPIQRQSQDYRLVDAATGEFERGRFRVADTCARQPWQDDVLVQVLEHER
ncbi:DUF3556 domain-containing protein [Mycobacterium sp. OTB74]|uniref:DUF3556 domain-containing protein n=1 Tax=Mycobacterium sp. OTB74 TaxID=1853452 RepID=UPI002473892A|nr:DUF3556 domain-containing protein [Mycobacterium sp. OTB74]MDH6242958.1 hypothetical protein [Mycobacterium sp. OTB74]